MMGRGDIVQLRLQLLQVRQSFTVKAGKRLIDPAARSPFVRRRILSVFVVLQAKQRHDFTIAEAQHQLFHFTEFCHTNTSI